jgi:hypothetical protein
MRKFFLRRKEKEKEKENLASYITNTSRILYLFL